MTIKECVPWFRMFTDTDMKVLHIANSYGSTQVYMNLVNVIDSLGFEQTIVVPLNKKSKGQINANMPSFKNPKSKIIYLPFLKRRHKLFYREKISTVLELIKDRVSLNTIDIIHAGTSFFDGAVAYEIHKLYDIPYIAAVRSTDKMYLQVFLFYRNYFKSILQEAGRVIFINSNMKEYILSVFNFKKEQLKKFEVIPNGISNIFLENIVRRTNSIQTPIRLLYSSAFIKRKCLKETIEASAILVKKGYNIRLDAYGIGLPNKGEKEEYVNKIKFYADKYDWFNIHSYVSLEKNMELMRKADILVMPSHGETFGLVYPEALSQGIPVLYGKNEGFDGVFKDGCVGYAAKPYDLNDISNGIENIIKNYDKIISNILNIDFIKQFSWSNIAKQYIDIYIACTIDYQSKTV